MRLIQRRLIQRNICQRAKKITTILRHQTVPGWRRIYVIYIQKYREKIIISILPIYHLQMNTSHDHIKEEKNHLVVLAIHNLRQKKKIMCTFWPLCLFSVLIINSIVPLIFFSLSRYIAYSLRLCASALCDSL